MSVRSSATLLVLSSSLLGNGCMPSNLTVGAWHHTGDATGVLRWWTHREPPGALKPTCGGNLLNLAERDRENWQVQVGCSGRIKQPYNEDPSIFLPFQGFNLRVVTRIDGQVALRDEPGAVGAFLGVAEWELGSEVRSLEGTSGQYRPLIIHCMVLEPARICNVLLPEDCEDFEGGTLDEHRVWIGDQSLTVTGALP